MTLPFSVVQELFGLPPTSAKGLALQLLDLFPVLLLTQGKKVMLVNTAEVMISSDYFETYDTYESKSQEKCPAQPCHSDMTSMSTSGAKIGRPSLVSKFPGVVQCAAELKQHCFSAHSQQRQETGMAGVSPGQIRDHLEQNIPGLKEYGISNHCFSLNGPS